MTTAQNDANATFYGGSLVFRVHLNGFSPDDMTHSQFIAMAAKLQCQISQAAKACMPYADVEIAMGRDGSWDSMDFAERALLGAIRKECDRFLNLVSPSEYPCWGFDCQQACSKQQPFRPEDQMPHHEDHGKREGSSPSIGRFAASHRAELSSVQTEKPQQ